MHGVHARSDDAVGAALTRVPAAHVVTAVHAAAFVAVEKSVAGVHAAHVRSVVSVGVAVWR